MAIYPIWLFVAYAIYLVIFGYSAPTSIEQFISDWLTTPRGWTLGDRVFVRRACAVHQRDLIPAAAGPRRRRSGGDADVASRDGGESAADGAVGINCRGPLGDRLDPILRRTHRGDAATWTRDLAPVPAYGRTGSQSALGLPGARTFWHIADIADALSDVCFFGVKRTSGEGAAGYASGSNVNNSCG
jgi:hypothetical protein